MALVECYECKRPISSVITACIHCGAPQDLTAVRPAPGVTPSSAPNRESVLKPRTQSVFDQPEEEVAPRKVGIPLLIGIIIFPPIFAWFLVRAGHTQLQRVLGFSWMMLGIVANLVRMQG